MRIAYISNSFADRSHTFIRREVNGLRSLGEDIVLFGIRPSNPSGLSEEELIFMRETRYLYPINIASVIFANMWFLFSKPFVYLKTLALAVFNEELSFLKHLKLIYHFFISCYTARLIQQSKATHIHAHFSNVSATIAMYSAALTGHPYSITLHSAGVAWLDSTIGLRAKIKRAKFLIAISRYTKDYYTDIIDCAEKIFVVHCGIDIDAYKRNSPRISGDRNRAKLIAVGRFEEKKGFSYLIEACGLLVKQNINIHLTMVGFGPLESELRVMADNDGLGKYVTFTGSLSPDAVKAELEKHDICIVPSVEASTGEKEGIPVVLMEAMAMGLAVVASSHSGIPEIVKDGQTGLLVPEKDPGAIAGAVKLLMDDPALFNRCVEGAKKIVLEEFDIKKTALRIKNIFEENL